MHGARSGGGRRGRNDLKTISLKSNTVTTQENRTGDFSEFLTVRVPKSYRYTFPSDKQVELFLPTHETFDTAGSGAQQTFELSHDLAESPATAGSGGEDREDTSPPTRGQSDLVLYADGDRVEPDAVRYHDHEDDPSEFDYEDDGTEQELDVYYLWRDSSQINARVEERNEESFERVFGSTAAATHTAKTFSDLQTVTFSNRFTVDEKERVRFVINSDVSLANWDAGMGDSDPGPNDTKSYAHVLLPVYKDKKG